MAWDIAKLTTWTPAHLETAAAFATEQAPLWLEHFETHRDLLAAMETWQGMSKEGAWESAAHSAATAVGAAHPTLNGAAQLTEVAGAATVMRQLVLDQIAAATADGLVVSPDLKQVTGPPGTQELAQAHAGMIKHYLAQFQGALDEGAQRIREQSEELGTVGFSDSGVKLTTGHNEPHVSMLDGKLKLGGGDWEPTMPDIGGEHLGAGGGQTPLESGLGGPAMPSQWPPVDTPPPPERCSSKEFIDDLRKATEHTAIEAGGMAVLPAEGPAVIPGVIGLIVNGNSVADDVGDMADCFSKGVD